MVIDQHSPTWASIEAFILEKSADARSELETFGVTPERTDYLRGRIAALGELHRLANPETTPRSGFAPTHRKPEPF